MRRAIIGLITAALLAAVSGCGLLRGQDPGAEPAGSTVEKARIRLGTIPIVDTAPVHIALKKGYFKDEGVEVEIKTIPGGAAGIPALVNGELDVTFGNWVSFFSAQAKGAADLRLVSDGYRAKPGMFLVLAAPDSPLRTAKDLANKKVAVNTRANVAELAVRAALRMQDVDPAMVQFVEMPFPEMEGALQRKDVDAALVVEPFISRAQLQIGAFTLLDTISGVTDDLPIAGYATSVKFAKENPKTLDAFRRALAKAQRDAADRREVEAVVTDYAKIDAGTASALHLGTYPGSIEPDRLRKLVELMRANGLLTAGFDPGAMLIQQ
jgi:NitT/TauT family transport system substrate-binding protein